MAGTDPSVNLVPGKNFTPPPGTPDFLAVGVTPGSRQQVAVAPVGGYGPQAIGVYVPPGGTQAVDIQTGRPATDPTLGDLSMYKGPKTGTGTKLSAAGPDSGSVPTSAPPAAAPQPPDTDHRPPPSPTAQIPAPAPSGDLQAFGQQVAAKYGIPWNVFYWAIQGESSWNPNVSTSSAGAQGIAQFIPGTAQQYGVNVHDPRSSLDGAGRYLSDLYRQSGSWVGALTGYLTGDPNRMPPLDVLEQNPAYATAYRNAGYTAQDRSFQTEVERTRAGYEEKARHANENLERVLQQIKAGQDDFYGKAMPRIRAAQDQADQAQAAAFRAIAQQPKAPVLDGVQHMSSIATIVGLLGGLFTKAPMLASTNAAAAAIEAYNAGDLRNFKLAHDNWKNQTDLLFKVADMQVARVRDIMSEEKMPIEEQRTRLDVTLRAFGLQEIADNARIEGPKAVADWIQQNQKLQADRDRLMQERDKPSLWFNQKDGKYYNVHPLSGRVDPAAPEGFVPGATATRGALPPQVQATADRLYADWLADPQNANATDSEKAAARDRYAQQALRDWSAAKRAISGAAADENAYTDSYVAEKVAQLDHKPTTAEIAKLKIEGRAEAKNTMRGIGVISDEAATLMAQQMILGTANLSQLPRSGPSRIKVENKFAELLRDEPEAARAVVMNRLRMLEAEAAARTAGRVTMQTEMFAQEAQTAGAEVVRTSKLVPRGDSPIFNRALEAFYRQEGDPNIIAFGAALNALVNAYGKMSNPTGTGIHDADKERLQQVIDTTLSQGQIEAGVNQIIREGQIISGAAQGAQGRVLQGLAPTGIGPSTGAPPRTGPPPPPAGGGGGAAAPHPPVPAAIRAQEKELDWSPTQRKFRNRRTGQIYDENGNPAQ